METTPQPHEQLTQSELCAANVVQKTWAVPLALDPAKYQHYLSNLELTDEQQTQALTALWQIMKSFVELGFGLDPVQQILTGAITKAWESENSDLKANQDVARISTTTINKDGSL